LPVGSEEAVKIMQRRRLRQAALLLLHPRIYRFNKQWADKFRKRNSDNCDDIKSLVGATIVHRALTQMIVDRGAKIDSTYQLNIGGIRISGT